MGDKQAAAPPPGGHPEAAEAVGLRYVSDGRPGIRRRRHGSGFRYLGADGAPLKDAATLARIKKLAIPPAWTDVWICPRADGHLQATGRDARGRKQYRYHEQWRACRDETKYGRMTAFGAALPAIRRRVEADLGLRGLPRAKVLAAAVRLLETTLIRVGNAEYARANRSFGLTTLRDRHVAVAGAKISFSFRGKSGKDHEIELSDRRLARIVSRCKELPGYELFQYLDDDGERQTIGSADVNGYLREISGQDFTAKDFRTWGGSVLACAVLGGCPPCASESEAKKLVGAAMERVAAQLGNTPAICRRSYVHPAVIDAFLAGTLAEGAAKAVGAASDLDPSEQRLLDLLASSPS
ncbi:MAG TPA: DNA topoisomerase IB [Herpetosiphonaceae bacterium]